MNRSNGISLSGVPGDSDGIYGRVIDIIMDANHVEYNERGASSSLYGVFFREIGRPYDEDRDVKTDFAYSQTDGSLRIPLKGEVVKIESQPSTDRDKNAKATTQYWTRVVNMWNHPQHSASPLGSVDENDFGEDFKETTDVNPLQGFPGDVLMEGRHGNSLRMGGTNFTSNIFSDEENNGKPFTILKVGQEPLEPHFNPTVEDVNKDKSSMYMMSDHKLGLIESNTNILGYKEGDEPDLADAYKGPQVLINSDRLFFNAKEESVFIAAKEQIGLASNQIALNASEYVGVDAKRIYLGTNAFDEDEPALKGATTKQWLSDLVKIIETTAQVLGKAPPAGTPYAAVAVGTFNVLVGSLKAHALLLNTIESNKVYIDKF
tara:strand:- start:512 stop:1639 length:1128 start_codon:yes stop_codon:yes gene_type:complete